MKRPDLHPEANKEIGEALAHYGYHAHPATVDELDGHIESALEEIAGHPTRYPFWERTRVRRVVFVRFPYVMFYYEPKTGVQVVAFAHTSRRPGYWKSRIAG